MRTLSCAFVLLSLLFSAVITVGQAAKPEDLAAEIENVLVDGLKLWYPASVDPRGGFHSTFSSDWKLVPSRTKGIVHQSRMTWTAAEVAHRRPEWKEQLEPIAKHGIAFLRDKMWDTECGGFYWEIADNGTPPAANSEMKHAYGISFGIYAAATVYELTKDEADLQLAKDAFFWLDRFGHDARFGGYREAFYRDGRPMLVPPQDRPNVTTGKVGEQLGDKSMNTHIHLLEAFTVLYKVWPDPLLRSRLEELLLIVRDKVTTQPAAMRLFFAADWTPAATLVSFGHDVEAAFLMEEAIEVLGRPDDRETLSVCKALVDHSLRFGWDKQYGGFWHEGATYADPVDRRKVWWVQAEGLNALFFMYHRYGETEMQYGQRFIEQWGFIKKSMLDAEHGGWFNTVSESGVHPPGEHSKANLWKTAYHETRALLNVAEGLKK
ncbi:MAG: AGE family epimerase/isomerase [Planctomycetaceae bacterium]|nr:AGE family epimerase/isomerase [Planctomycetaceae bacterium]